MLALSGVSSSCSHSLSSVLCLFWFSPGFSRFPRWHLLCQHLFRHSHPGPYPVTWAPCTCAHLLHILFLVLLFICGHIWMVIWAEVTYSLEVFLGGLYIWAAPPLCIYGSFIEIHAWCSLSLFASAPIFTVSTAIARPASVKEGSQWDRLNARIRSFIFLNCTPSVVGHIKSMTEARKIWLRLGELFNRMTSMKRIAIEAQVRTLNPAKSSSVREHINKL